MRCVVCGAYMPDLHAAYAAHWDWFTGYFDRTAHFCAKHRDSVIREVLNEQALRRPPMDGTKWSLDRAIDALKNKGANET